MIAPLLLFAANLPDLPDSPFPPGVGEVLRGLVVLEGVLIVSCAVFVADRHRTAPVALHYLVWALAAVAIGVVVGVCLNTVALPPTIGVGAVAGGMTVAAVLAVLAARHTRRTPPRRGARR